LGYQCIRSAASIAETPHGEPPWISKASAHRLSDRGHYLIDGLYWHLLSIVVRNRQAREQNRVPMRGSNLHIESEVARQSSKLLYFPRYGRSGKVIGRIDKGNHRILSAAVVPHREQDPRDQLLAIDARIGKMNEPPFRDMAEKRVGA